MENNVIGQIQINPDAQIPNGWVPCEGQKLKIAEHPALFACIGAQHGGDGVSHFTVPDFAHSHDIIICVDGRFPLEGTDADEQYPLVSELEDYLGLRVKAFQEAYRNGIPPIKAHLHAEFRPIKDDLTRIEGIGPKSRDVLLSGSITSFELLANTRSEVIEEILNGAGLRMLPNSYADQAKLAAAGKWDELKVLQEELFGGRTNKPR